jgi:hypothetical protein
MHKEDGQMQSIATFGPMQSEQLMMEETMLQPIRVMNVLSLDSVERREYQPLRTNITLDAQYMFYNRKFKMVEKQGNGRIEQG